MRLIFLITMLLIPLVGCSNEQSFDDNSAEINLSKNWETNSHCRNFWNTTVQSWVAEHGKQSSVKHLREVVESDERETLSLIIKSAWTIQEKEGFYDSNVDFGAWPIPLERQWESGPYLHYVDSIPDGCRVHDYIFHFSTSLLSDEQNEINMSSLKLEQSEYQQWLVYWLFTNIKL